MADEKENKDELKDDVKMERAVDLKRIGVVRPDPNVWNVDLIADDKSAFYLKLIQCKKLGYIHHTLFEYVCLNILLICFCLGVNKYQRKL